MLSIVTWLWAPKANYRSKFSGHHVNVLRAMVARHYPHPHRFLCVTDIPQGIGSDVEIVPAWNDFENVTSPYGMHQPSCYRRLRMFHPAIAETFGPRFVSMDLDTVIVGDMSAIWNRSEDFIAWGETNPRSYYNGSMLEMNAGARTKVWTDFDPVRSPAMARAADKFGSDQGWLSYCLGPGEATWTRADGVYSYNVHLRRPSAPLPEHAKIVMFHGSVDPWAHEAQQLPWVREHYRIGASCAV